MQKIDRVWFMMFSLSTLLVSTNMVSNVVFGLTLIIWSVAFIKHKEIENNGNNNRYY